MPDDALDVGRIRSQREKLNLTQAAAAKLAGLSGPQQWNDIESGRRATITLETLTKVASALKLKPRDLLK